MSYWCVATQDFVDNEPCVLCTVEIRKVIYIAQTKPDKRSDFLQFVGQSEGWEIVKAVPVRASSAEWFKTTHPPEIVGEKEVRFMVPNKAKEKPTLRRDEWENDKPEEML